MSLGDFRLGDTFYLDFTTTNLGVPATLSGGTLSAYPADSLTEITAGITLTPDFDSRTGLNHIKIVASSGNGYATATDYSLVLTAGTVGGNTVVGYQIDDFSIEHRSALMPTTPALTLDVSAGGEAGLDWANVGSPTTANALTNTSIVTTQKVDVNTIKTNPVVNAGTVTFPTTATLASTTNITGGTITTVSNLTTNNDKLGYELDATSQAAIVAAIFAHAFSVAYGSYTFEQLIGMDSAALLAVCSGMATATGVFRNLANSADVITATIDANGNRTAVTLAP